ncbi:putative metal-binding motif-containing protein [Solirubrobacter sp. CPCC 204708]|uniref:Metal-binding motif-containing protein n=1 Tax=Solirubrobacter deserti TaxID=2282478 RepID=A0ABT4RR80_9ACTN|nr:putative metal-binding motif-containing protein [Solirubrobacter deserti]MBE2314859.1 putative metal-binding motif-containing protein [Solirubrobacter deserti]MDA0141086.1 putative metal-binding motif-containing protein [Solirubrobacter deserti]
MLRRLPVIAVLLLLSLNATARAGTITVRSDPPGAGTITGDAYVYSPRGGGSWSRVLNCGITCTAPLSTVHVCTGPEDDRTCQDEPTAVRMRAAAKAGWTFNSWSGCVVRSDGYCHTDGGEESTLDVIARFTDTGAPDVELAPQAPGDRLASQPWRFTATASDNSGAVSVTFAVGDRTITDPHPPFDAEFIGFDAPSVVVTATASDAAGNSRVSSQTYLVDRTPPAVSIVRGPALSATGTAEVVFAYDDKEAAAVRCRIDADPYDACTSLSQRTHRAERIADGEHVFEVAAEDAYGNVRVARHTFRVDTTPPETAIPVGHGHGIETSQTDAYFEFASSEAGRFECRLDTAPFAACAAKLTLSGLADGPHTLEVRAVDVAGHRDPTPATRTWTITADLDRDGFRAGQDCDDADPAVHPSAPEVPANGRDENCDGVDTQAPPAPPPPPPSRDRDEDGYNVPQDCDDADATVNPGARDAPGDAADEDCSGSPEPWPVLRSYVRMPVQWAARDPRSNVLRLELTDLPRGTVVTVSCASRKRGVCPYKSRRHTAARAGTLVVRKPFGARRLPAGTRIEITAQPREAIGLVVSFVLRAGAVPKRTERCLAPGATKPSAC